MWNFDADQIVLCVFHRSRHYSSFIELIAFQPDPVAFWKYLRFDIGGMHRQQKFHLTLFGVDLSEPSS